MGHVVFKGLIEHKSRDTISSQIVSYPKEIHVCLLIRWRGFFIYNGPFLPKHFCDYFSQILPPGLIFYDTKVTVMNRVLNATVQRTADHAAPEITLDPLEIVGGEMSHTNQKMQAAAPG